MAREQTTPRILYQTLAQKKEQGRGRGAIQSSKNNKSNLHQRRSPICVVRIHCPSALESVSAHTPNHHRATQHISGVQQCAIAVAIAASPTTAGNKNKKLLLRQSGIRTQCPCALHILSLSAAAAAVALATGTASSTTTTTTTRRRQQRAEASKMHRDRVYFSEQKPLTTWVAGGKGWERAWHGRAKCFHSSRKAQERKLPACSSSSSRIFIHKFFSPRGTCGSALTRCAWLASFSCVCVVGWLFCFTTMSIPGTPRTATLPTKTTMRRTRVQKHGKRTGFCTLWPCASASAGACSGHVCMRVHCIVAIVNALYYYYF